MAGGLIENIRRAAEATEQLADGTARVRQDLEAISEIEPDLPADSGFGATVSGSSVAPIGGGGAGGGSFLEGMGGGGAGGGGVWIGGGSGSGTTGGSIAGVGGGGSFRVGMGGGGAGGGGGVVTSPEANAFLRKQLGADDAVARAVAVTITDGFNMLAKILKGDGGARFRIGGGL